MVRPLPGTVLHFSEDPSISEFPPRVAPTSTDPEAVVWAVDADRAPDYWFPRDCPRLLAWVGPSTVAPDRELIDGLRRLHLVEHAWVDRMATTTLYAYRLPAATFVPEGEHAHAVVSTVAVQPLGPPVAVGDLLGLHSRAGIVLQAVDSLWPWVDRITPSTLEFSGIRLGTRP